MPARVLTARNVKTLRPRPGRVSDVYFDRTKGAPPGFALRVTTGARWFVLIYRFGGDGKKRWMRLEAGPELSGGLGDARREAGAARALLRKGMDPQVEHERLRVEREEAARRRELEAVAEAARPTLAGLVARFIEAHATKYRPKTLELYRSILRAHVELAPLAGMFASDVRRYQLREWLEKIAKATPIMANRVQQLIRGAYSWGIREELDDALEANPAADFEIHDEQPLPTEERTLDAAEVRKLWRGLDALNEAGARIVSTAAAAYIRVLLLCGLRRTEAALAEWHHVNLKGREWLIPAANRKAAGRRGKKAKERELILPLSSTVKEILTELRDVTGPDGPVFGKTALMVRTNPDRFVKRLRDATGVDFKLHDLRATCATGAGEGAAPFVVSLILGHAVLPGAAAATPLYDRARRLKDVRDALEKWARQVHRIVEGKGAEVLPMARA